MYSKRLEFFSFRIDCLVVMVRCKQSEKEKDDWIRRRTSFSHLYIRDPCVALPAGSDKRTVTDDVYTYVSVLVKSRAIRLGSFMPIPSYIKYKKGKRNGDSVITVIS